MTRILLPLVLALPTLALGCGDEDSLADSVARYTDERSLQQSIWCDCHELFGYETRSDCERDIVAPGPSQQRCIEDALARDEDSARAWLDCIVPLEEEYTQCLNARLSCAEDELDAVDQCGADYDVGREECIELPESVGRAIDDCFPE